MFQQTFIGFNFKPDSRIRKFSTKWNPSRSSHRDRVLQKPYECANFIIFSKERTNAIKDLQDNSKTRNNQRKGYLVSFTDSYPEGRQPW